jgi:hypothetical protein
LVFHRTVTIIKINTITNIIKLYRDSDKSINIRKNQIFEGIILKDAIKLILKEKYQKENWAVKNKREVVALKKER